MSELDPADAGPESFKPWAVKLPEWAKDPAVAAPLLGPDPWSAVEVRMWAMERLWLLPIESTVAEIAIAANQIGAFIDPDAREALGGSAFVNRFAYDFMYRFRDKVRPVAEIIGEAEVLARFIETGEMPAATVASPPAPSAADPLSPQGLSPSGETPPASAVLPESPSEVSIGGVAAPMVAGRNDSGNGVVSTPIQDGGA